MTTATAALSAGGTHPQFQSLFRKKNCNDILFYFQRIAPNRPSRSEEDSTQLLFLTFYCTKKPSGHHILMHKRKQTKNASP